ncbi:MAG: thioredoxin [Pseudonocardia sp.]|uniref:thioredoxin n=1 Tax=unclassified Pseudonocardia TaxID=2619320 RepID=UPI0008693117|nr:MULTISPECIES: thioredoxin [unclassified Pseudonocardia]MBN9110490.1 thioredoxin [Pseudonocardia sp.]ODU29808.1 MAG: thioredoxin [Pseudonocardia sp. SCN 72-51]ODV03432.1 MAG: thioredoxin [Pseudonocardia sp. SCN 73-27]
MTATATARRIVTCPNCGKRNRLPAAAPRDGDTVPRCGNCHHPLPWITDADDGDFAAVVEQASIPVLVDIWATWCGPCRMVSPVLEQLATERAGELKLVKVDVDAAPATAERFEVRAVPTLLLMRGGQVVARQAGAAPLPALQRWLDDGLVTSNTPTEEST